MLKSWLKLIFLVLNFKYLNHETRIETNLSVYRPELSDILMCVLDVARSCRFTACLTTDSLCDALKDWRNHISFQYCKWQSILWKLRLELSKITRNLCARESQEAYYENMIFKTWNSNPYICECCPFTFSKENFSMEAESCLLNKGDSARKKRDISLEPMTVTVLVWLGFILANP